MVIVQLKNTREFEHIMKSISKIANDVTLEFSNNTIKIFVLGAGSITAMSATINTEPFTQSNRATVVVADVLKAIKNNTAYEIDSDGATMHFVNDRKKVSIAVLEDSPSSVKLPPPGTTTIKTPLREFREAIDDTAMFSDRFKVLVANGKELVLSGYSSDNSSRNSCVIRKPIVETVSAECIYAQSHYEPLKDLEKVFTDCTISFGEQYPLLVSMVNEDCSVEFFVAPIVDLQY